MAPLPRPGRRGQLLLLLLVAMTPAGDARAANCAPTPVTPLFEDLPCLTVVERSSDPTLTLEWDYDPDLVQMATLGGPQTMSLVAFRSRPELLPLWLSTDIYEGQKDAYSGGECEVPDAGPDDILETNEALAGQWTLITPTPLPVTLDQAAEGFVWDTTGLEPGTYHVFAFTDAGRFPAWTIVRGGITIVDDLEDISAVPPGIFLLDPVGLNPIPGEVYNLRGCTFAMPGSEIDVDWSEAVPPPGDKSWNPVAACLPQEGEMVRVPYMLPEEAAGAQVQLRATVRDPMGREDTTFTLYSLVAESCTGDNPGSHCEGFEPGDPSAFPDDRCENDPDTGGTADGGDGGCGCQTTRTMPSWAWLGALVLGFRRRRGRVTWTPS